MPNDTSPKTEKSFFRRPMIIVALVVLVVALIANFIVGKKLHEISPPPLEIYVPQKAATQPAAPQPTAEPSQAAPAEQPAENAPAPTAQ